MATQRLRVLTWIELYSNKFGSLEEYCVFLTEELVSRGHSSILAFPRPPFRAFRDRLTEAGAEIVELQIPRGPFGAARLSRRIRELGVDVVHGTFLPIFSLLPAILKFAGVSQTVFSDQNSRPELPTSRRRLSLSALKTRVVSRWIDLIIADAEYVRDSVVNDSGFPVEKVMVLYNGVNPSRFTPAREAPSLRADLGIGEDVEVVASVTHVTHEKGLDIYLQAAGDVLEHLPDAVFLIVGDGPLVTELTELAQSLGISDNVIFTGLMDETQDVFAISDVIVLLSRWREAFAFSMLETMASGKPLVASRIGAIPEGVIDGETGLLVPPCDPEATAEALLALLQDRDRAQRLGSAARRRCEEHFDVRDMVKKTVDAYEKGGIARSASD
jgi:glycosyltransferase involved in cell wall biosynthesis